MERSDMSQALGTIRWAVVCAVAPRLYMPERATHDLDIVILADDARETRQRLREVGFEYLWDLSTGGSAWLSPVLGKLEMGAD